MTKRASMIGMIISLLSGGLLVYPVLSSFGDGHLISIFILLLIVACIIAFFTALDDYRYITGRYGHVEFNNSTYASQWEEQYGGKAYYEYRKYYSWNRKYSNEKKL
jgi:hypothetical protein